MRSISFPEFLAASGLDNQRLKVLRSRRQVALSFGRDQAYESLGYIELDVVAPVLADGLAGRIGRRDAAALVLNQWPSWTAAAAIAEEVKPEPVHYFVVNYLDQKGRPGRLPVCTRQWDLRAIANDVRRRFGVNPKDYVAMDMTEVISEVRRAARAHGFDFSEPLLPLWGDPQLAEILKPFDAGPDRITVVTPKEAKRGGVLGRAKIEADL
jgi:hypothetical protein